MSIVPKEEFDQAYFYGKEGTYAHNAGYTNYDRMEPRLIRHARDLTEQFNLVGKTVLEIGCAKGFMVKEMRNLGVKTVGVEGSVFIVGRADIATQSYITVMDADKYLLTAGKFDFVFSVGFLECLTAVEVVDMLTAINKIATEQYHEVLLPDEDRFYLKKTKVWWESLNWKNTTLKISSYSSVKVG